MKQQIRTGISFGLTSGIITTLGLIVGLHSGTHSKTVVIGGILIIAIADAFSDAFGIHISEESENIHTTKEIWESTIYTFLSKFIFALIFVIPVLLFELSIAIIASVILGLFMLGIFSFIIAREQKTKPWKVILEHLIIALVVIVITHYVGDLVGTLT
jgi:VIT1/CCC1 family predicted Fe2+/Mn2+ transporter